MRKTILTFIVAAMGTCMAHSEDYEHVSASYECSFLKPTKEFKSTDDVIQLHGGYLNYAHGFQLRERTFLETGIGISALTGNAEPMMDTDGNALNQKITNCYLKLPVNLVYRLPLDDKLSLSLFAGIAGKCNLYYKSKVSAGNSAIPGLDVSYTSDLLSLSEMGENNVWHRWQVAWQIGAGLNIKSVYIGISGGSDIIPPYSHRGTKARMNSASINVTVGYTFHINYKKLFEDF